MRLELCGLSKQFDAGRMVLQPMDLQTEIHTLAIIGPSGGGKSTLLRIIGGLIPPSTGTILVDGEPIIWQGKLIASCFDCVVNDIVVNTAHQMPATLAELEL